MLDGPGWTGARVTCDIAFAALAAVLVAHGRVGTSQIWLVAFPPLVALALGVRGQYRRRRRPLLLDELAPLAAAVGLATLAGLVAGVALGAPPSSQAAAILWPLAVLCVAVPRAGLVLAQRRARGVRAASGSPVLIVGAGEVGRRVARRLLEQPQFGLRPVGFLESVAHPGLGAPPLPVIGTPAELGAAATVTGARHVLLAFPADPDSAVAATVRLAAARHELAVAVVPRLFDSMTAATTYEPVGGLPLLWLHRPAAGGWQFAVKHALDRLAAAVLLLLLAPLLAIVALAIRCSSPGPAVFRQRRVGVGGATFEVLKFRSMRLQPPGPAWTPPAGFAPGGVEGEDRRTAIGRLLRRTSLDELPQLVNVLRGEMSLVGPRPERPEFVSLFAPAVDRYSERHRVRPGITGWAQVNGLRGGDSSLADRVEWDNFYVEHWSPAMDAKILALTVLAVLRAAE